MPTFTDTLGRTFVVVIDVAAVKRVREVLQVDLVDAAAGALFEKLASDPILLADVLRLVCRPDAEPPVPLAPEEFTKGLSGNVFDDAGAALIRALLDFFPKAQRAAALGRLMQTLETMRNRLAEVAETMGRAATGNSSGDSPESLESTPVPGPSAS